MKQLDNNIPTDYKEKEKELEANFAVERKKYETKINTFELKIYSINEEKKNIEKEMLQLNEEVKKLQHEIEKLKENGRCAAQMVQMPERDDDKNNGIKKDDQGGEAGNEMQTTLVDKDNTAQCNHDKTPERECVPKETHEKTVEQLRLITQDHCKINTNLINTQKEYNEIQKQFQEWTAKCASLEKVKSEYEEGETTKTQEQTLQKDEMIKAHKQELEEFKENYERELLKKASAFKKFNESSSKTINEYIYKIKEYEDKLKTLNNELTETSAAKAVWEDIWLKQEERVNDLGNQVTKIEIMWNSKNEDIKQNEAYSIRWMNIIEDQKVQMTNMKNSRKQADSNELLNLQNQISSWKGIIELRDTTIITLQKSHKLLQEKYFRLSSDNRKKGQEELLNQAKDMKAKKIERDRLSANHSKTKAQNEHSDNKPFPQRLQCNNQYSNLNSKISTKNEEIEETTFYRQEKESKKAVNKNINNIPDNSGISNNNIYTNILPPISKDKVFVNMKSWNISEEDGKIDEINNLMRNIIDEF